MGESHKNNVERKEPDTKEYTPYDSIHVKLKTDKLTCIKSQDSNFPWPIGSTWKLASGVLILSCFLVQRLYIWLC